jgi:hypothetical protein
MSNPPNWIRQNIRPHVYDGEIRKTEGEVRFRIIPKKEPSYVILSSKSIDQLKEMDKYHNCEIERVK